MKDVITYKLSLDFSLFEYGNNLVTDLNVLYKNVFYHRGFKRAVGVSIAIL